MIFSLFSRSTGTRAKPTLNAMPRSILRRYERIEPLSEQAPIGGPCPYPRPVSHEETNRRVPRYRPQCTESTNDLATFAERGDPLGEEETWPRYARGTLRVVGDVDCPPTPRLSRSLDGTPRRLRSGRIGSGIASTESAEAPLFLSLLAAPANVFLSSAVFSFPLFSSFPREGHRCCRRGKSASLSATWLQPPVS